MLGIAEALDPSFMNDKSEFTKMVRITVDGIRAALEEPDLPFFIGELEKYGPGFPNWPSGNAIDQQIMGLSQVLSNTSVISCKGFQYIDEHHFHRDDTRAWAQRLGDTIGQGDYFPYAPPDNTPPFPTQWAYFSNLTDSGAVIRWENAKDENSFISHYEIGVNEGFYQDIYSPLTQCSLITVNALNTVSIKSVDIFDNVSPPYELTLAESWDSNGYAVDTIFVTNITDTSLTLNWDFDSLSAGYHFELMLNSLIYKKAVIPPISVKGLSSNTSYSIVVSVRDVQDREVSRTRESFITTLPTFFVEQYPFGVNAGGGTSGIFQADMPYLPGGDYGYVEPIGVKTKALVSPTGDSVFATAREANVLSYVVRVNEPALYSLTVFFQDLWTTGWGSHILELTTNNGLMNLPHENLFDTEIGAAFPAHTANYEVGVQEKFLRLRIGAIAGQALLNAFTIDKMEVYRIESPGMGDTVMVGDSLNVIWKADYIRATSALIGISTDNGRTWTSIVNAISIDLAGAVDHSYKWPVPSDLLNGGSEVSARVRVSDYADVNYVARSEAFIIRQ